MATTAVVVTTCGRCGGVPTATIVTPSSSRAITPAGLAQLVEQARRDWLAAQRYFNEVTEPDLVDHAIYSVQAAERRYVYLLRLAARLEPQPESPAPERVVPDADPAARPSTPR